MNPPGIPTKLFIGKFMGITMDDILVGIAALSWLVGIAKVVLATTAGATPVLGPVAVAGAAATGAG
jgi:hypothetical protein